MPAITPQELIAAVLNAIQDSGFAASLISSPTKHPRKFAVDGPAGSFKLTVYAWTLTFGGRASLPDEYRIQMTSVKSPLAIPDDGPTVLIGYHPGLNLFAGFDLIRHRTFTTGSPSVQVDLEKVKEAEVDGLSFHRKNNAEVAVGFRPDHFVPYCLNAEAFHKFGKDATVIKLLAKAASQQVIVDADVSGLSVERQRLIQQISRLSRDRAFRRKVLYAYGNTCAVTRMQLKLVDAAHILPVEAPGGSDNVRNGVALSPTYHRAFDAKLIYLDDQYRMQVNPVTASQLVTLNLAGGLADFKATLGGKILLPPDKLQWPLIDFIKKGNQFRQIPV